MYFCNARYYIPEWCRWLSQDSVNYIDPDSADGLNLFAYCNNNPVMYADPSGHSISMLVVFLICAIIGAAAGTGIAIHEKKKGWDFVKTVLIGTGIGLAAAGLGIASYSAGVGASAAISGKLVKAMAFGMPVKRAFSIGALSYNTFAFVVAPLIGIDDMEGIEVGPIAPRNEGASGVVPSGYIK